MPIQTVLLDAGGVLVNSNWSRVSDTLARHGVDVAAEPHAKRRIDMGETIRATTDQQRGWTYFNLVLTGAGVAQSDATVAGLAELHAPTTSSSICGSRLPTKCGSRSPRCAHADFSWWSCRTQTGRCLAPSTASG